MFLKNSWDREIQKDLLEQKRLIEFFFKNDEEKDEIIKGVVDDINYSESNLKFIQKTGKEIKEKLEGELLLLTVKVTECNTGLSDLLNKIGQKPILSRNREGYEGLFVFDYKQIYPGRGQKLGQGLGQGLGRGLNESEISSEECEKAQEMRKYNELIYFKSRLNHEIKMINTLISNIELKKIYKLTLNIASKLGF